MTVILECVQQFSIRGGPLYTPGDKAGFEPGYANMLLTEHAAYWKKVSREAATPIVTAAPHQAPQDKMLRVPERRKGRHE